MSKQDVVFYRKKNPGDNEGKTLSEISEEIYHKVADYGYEVVCMTSDKTGVIVVYKDPDD